MSAHAFVGFGVGSKDRTPSRVEPFPQSNAMPSTDVELDDMAIGLGAVHTGLVKEPASAYTRGTGYNLEESKDIAQVRNLPNTSELRSPGDIEGISRRPSSPAPADGTSVLQTVWSPPMNKWRVLSCCMILFCNGANDSAPGALLPYMESHYDIGYAVVSLIFVSNAAGFILAAFFVGTLDNKLGRANTLILCDLVYILAYVIITVTPPYPVFVICFFLTGLAEATGLALNNVFCANLAGSATVIGISQGAYGIGGIVGPIVATTLVTNGLLFSRFYTIMIGGRALSLFLAAWAFWNLERDNEPPTELLTSGERAASEQASGSANARTSKFQELRNAITNHITIAGALLIFAYQGAEVSISGWVISYLINYRGSNPAKVGYVTAYFWAGITVGRFFLAPTASRIGEKTFVYVLGFGALAFQLVVWLVPNVVGETVAIALVGLLLGPIYPVATTVFARLLPRSLQKTALAFIGSAGSSGGAVAPFLTGLLSSAVGTWVLHPVVIGLFVVMEGCWFLLPSIRKRQE